MDRDSVTRAKKCGNRAREENRPAEKRPSDIFDNTLAHCERRMGADEEREERVVAKMICTIFQAIIKKKPVINANWTRRPSPSRLCPAEYDCVALCPDTP